MEDEAVESSDGFKVEDNLESADTKVDAATKKRVSQVIEAIKDSKKYFDKDFARMRKCIHLAKHGADREWVDSDKYVVPIINRHVNQTVSRLYAKNPRAVVERRKKVYFKEWDGKPETAQAALMSVQNAMAQAAQMQQLVAQQPVLPGMMPPAPPQPQIDPQAVAILEEIKHAQQDIQLLDQMAKTMTVVDDYFMNEQATSYKRQLKRTVRRAKVTGVGYALLGLQRIMGEEQDETLDRDQNIADIRSKIERAEEISKQGSNGELQEDSPEIEELRQSLKDLEEKENIIVREGPVMSFPRSTQVIVDKKCTHLATFAGAEWVAVEYDMTPSRILQKYGQNVEKRASTYNTKSGEKKNLCKVWVYYDKTNQQVSVVCDGFDDWLEAPKTPDVRIDRFFPIFAFVLNECEDDDDEKDCTIYPLSDVWQARHPQYEYNRAREGLREHRQAARPYHVTAKGVLEKEDHGKLGTHEPHEIVELNVPAGENFDIAKAVQRGPTAPIDPNLYEIEGTKSDVLMAVGSQEANLGGVSGGTATESSIAESSRMTTIEEDVDSLDEFLSEMAHARGQLLFLEMSYETIVEIAGPGAVWPQMPVTREQVAKDLLLTIKAGSSGRPNAAAELANMDRAMPFIVQFQGVNPKPYIDRYNALLDIETDEATAEGLPSVTALNAMIGSGGPGGQPTGDPASDPNAQGAAGANNAATPPGQAPGPQPAYPESGQAMEAIN